LKLQLWHGYCSLSSQLLKNYLIFSAWLKLKDQPGFYARAKAALRLNVAVAQVLRRLNSPDRAAVCLP
jgi:hypothetical protein